MNQRMCCYFPVPRVINRKDIAPWTRSRVLPLSLSLCLSLSLSLSPDMEDGDTSPPPLSLVDPPTRVEPEGIQTGQPPPPRLEWLEPDPQQTLVPSLVPDLQTEAGGVLLQQSMEEVVPTEIGGVPVPSLIQALLTEGNGECSLVTLAP
jgi:hypothetical protein